MSDELRAAAELIAGWRPFATNEIGVTSCDKYIMNKMIYVARAYLALIAEHPADDAEPVTEEWLASVGFKEGVTPNGRCKIWEKTVVIQEHGFGEGPTHHWLRVHERCDDWWPINFLQQGSDQSKPDAVALLSWIDMTTRGDLRRLCRALGIPLKEQA